MKSKRVKRIIGAKAEPNGKTFLRFSDGDTTEELQINGDLFYFPGTEGKANTPINPTDVEIKQYVREFEDTSQVVLCLGKIVDISSMNLHHYEELFEPFEDVDSESEVSGMPPKVGEMGFMFVNLDVDTDSAKGSGLFIPEMYRGLGLAKALIREAEKISKTNGKKDLCFNVLRDNRPMNSLLRSLGYKQTIKSDSDETHLWKKTLSH